MTLPILTVELEAPGSGRAFVMSIELHFAVFSNPNPGSWPAPTPSSILASAPRRIGQRWGATRAPRCAANGTTASQRGGRRPLGMVRPHHAGAAPCD